MLKSLRFKSLLLVIPVLLSACGSSETSAPPKPSAQPKSSPPPASESLTTVANVQQADPFAHGKRVFAKCKTCHTLDEGGANKVGPNLYGFLGQKAGHKDDFNYSSAMKNADIVWDDETLSKFLENPVKDLPGTRMSFVGVRNEADRKALLEYLHETTKP